MSTAAGTFGRLHGQCDHEHGHNEDITHEHAPHDAGHEHEPIISRRWKVATVMGNLAVGAWEIISGNTSTLSVTADGIHNAGDALSYYVQADNIIDNEKISEEKLQRRRKFGHSVIAISSGIVAAKAGVDILSSHEPEHGHLGIAAASTSMAMNAGLYWRMRSGMRKKAKAEGHTEKTAAERDLNKHMLGLDIPSAALAFFGATMQKVDVSIEQYTAIGSGLLGAYLFRPTKANLSHEGCPLHGSHEGQSAHGTHDNNHAHRHSGNTCGPSHEHKALHAHNHAEHSRSHLQELVDEDLQQVREAKHKAFAKRQRTGLFSKFFNKKTKQEKHKYYLEASDEYYQKLEKYLNNHADELKNSGKSHHDESTLQENINKKIVDKILNVANEDQVLQRKELINSGNILEKLKYRYEKLSTKNKVIVGLGSVAVGSAVVAGGSLVAVSTGLAGLTAGGLAGGLAGAARFLRSHTFNSSKIYQKEGSRALMQLSDEEVNHGVHSEIITKAVEAMRNENERQMQKSDIVRRRAVYSSLGTVAIGGLAGSLIEHTGIFSNGKEPDQSVIVQDTPDNSTASLYDPPLNDSEPQALTEGAIDVPDYKNHEPALPPPEPEISPIDNPGIYPQEAMTVSSGEGWYGTFYSLGIDPAAHSELLEKIGPELSDIYHEDGSPLAYYQQFGAGGGEWRMSMPSNKELPLEALKFIENQANLANVQ